MRNMDIFHTVSGQYDPTAGTALSNIIGEERRAKRLEAKTIKAITGGKKVRHSAATITPYRDLMYATIALSYQDYVKILRLLEALPEPAATADERIVTKHNERINQLKEEMESIEEFFYSPLYELACDINPDILIKKAWKEAYR